MPIFYGANFFVRNEKMRWGGLKVAGLARRESMTTTTNTAAATMTTTTMTMRVEKGCAARGLRKGDVVRHVSVTEVPGTGFRVTFEAWGARKMAFWATNRARLQEGRFSLNTGNPLERIVLVG